MKKLLVTILAAAFFVPFIAFATQITVPSAPGTGYGLTSTTTGAYIFIPSSGIAGDCVQWAANNGFADALLPCGTGSGGGGVATTSLLATYPIKATKTTASITYSLLDMATSSGTVSSPLTGNFICVGTSCTLGIQAASASQAGSMAAVDYNRLYSATSTFSSPLVYTLSTNAVTCPTCQTSAFTDPNWTFANNALEPTTTVGILVSASSTIGSGLQAGGLTISGGATTTGSAYIGGNLGVGVQNPLALIDAEGSGIEHTLIRSTGASNYAYMQVQGSGGSINAFYVFGSSYAGTGSETAGSAELFSNASNFNFTNGNGTGVLNFYTGGTSASNLRAIIAANGNVGIGTSSPTGLLALQANNGTNYTGNLLFNIASSTANATTTLFSIANNGSLISGGGATSTFSNGLNLTTGCITYNGGTCLTSNTGTVTSLVAGNGLNGGTITTSGTISLKSYGATSSAETAGQIAVFSSTNGTPWTLYSAATSTPTVSAPLTYSGTLGSFIGGVSGAFGCTTASSGVTGCLSGTDWTTFNGKQAAGNYITALTGDVTASGPGSVAATLKNTGTAGTYRSTTFDAQGRETSGTNPTTFGGYAISDTSANLAAALTDETGTGLAVFNTIPTFSGLLDTASSTATSLFNFANATTALQTITGNIWLTALGTSAGTFLAVDPNGKVIATSTPSGSNSAFSPAANYATTGVLAAYTYTAGVITEVGSGALSVDGANPSVGQRVLVKNETGACTSSAGGCNNGLYDVTAAGSGIAAFVLTRDAQYNSSSNIIPGIITYVISGTVNNDDFYAMTAAAPITVGTTALTYVEVSGGGAAVTSVSNGDGTLTISPTAGAVVASLALGHANTWTGLQTINNASSTNATFATFLTIPHSSNPQPTISGAIAQSTNAPYQLQIGNNAGATTVFDPRPAFELQVASTTVLTGTTTSPVFLIPFGLTVTNWSCTAQPGGAAVEAQWTYANPSAYTNVTSTYLAASTTPGNVAIASNNTPTAGATSTLAVGAPTGSATGVSCYFYGNQAAI